MNSFLRKGETVQRKLSGGTTLFARRLCVRCVIVIALLVFSIPAAAQAPANDYLFNDSHFHLTNYI